MLIKNNSKRLYNVQGILIAPGAEPTEIPAHLVEAVERDIDGLEDLEVAKERAKPGPKAKEQDDDKK